MNRLTTKAVCVLALLLLLVTFQTATCTATTSEQIFVWVSRQMNIEFIYGMPEVQYVERQQLQRMFQDLSQRSFKKWQIEHGEEEASIIMASYLNRVVGFFHPETQTIYVGAHLTECAQQSVLAHEITHYFQHLKYGPISSNSYGADERRMIREMEAYRMGNKYEEFFCASNEAVNRTLALLYYP